MSSLSIDEINRLKEENKKAKEIIAELSKIIQCKTGTIATLADARDELKAELQKYKDMEAKGLEEFKEVGGCLGCGLQLQLNQDMEDIKQLIAEKERLKEEKGGMQILIDNYITLTEKYHQTLQEIKAIVKNICDGCTSECDCDEDCNYFLITEQLTKAESEG